MSVASDRTTISFESNVANCSTFAAVRRFSAADEFGSVDAFLHSLFLRGAFQGAQPRDAYFVRCESSTMTPSDMTNGIVNITVGFAPLKPAEFVLIRLSKVIGGEC